MEQHILSYHVYNNGKWLADDEKSWSVRFSDAAEFTSYELADDIAKRETSQGKSFYVFACMASR